MALLFRIFEYIIYISFISSITKQLTMMHILRIMYSLKLKGIISSDIKHIITRLILIFIAVINILYHNI